MGFEGLFRAVALVGHLHLRGENTRAPSHLCSMVCRCQLHHKV